MLAKDIVGIHFFDFADKAFVLAFARNRKKLCFTDVLNLEIEEVIFGCLFADGYAACKKLYLRLIGVYRHLCNVLHAVYVAFAADMHEGLIRKPRFVSIKSVLFILPVYRNKSFVVLAVLTALCSRICAEVEHIPDVRGPDIFSRKELTDERFVIDCLIFLCIVTAFGI